MNTPRTAHNRLAIVALLFSSSLWGVIWYPLRWLDEAGMSAVWSSLVMYLAAGALALPFLFKQDIFNTSNGKDLLFLALAAGITNIAFLVALTEGEVMRVMLLFYLSPIWSVLLSRWWLKERLSSSAIAMLVLAMTGSLVMLWDTSVGWPWPQGLADWLAITAGIAFSINNVLARKLASVSMAAKTGVIWWGVVIASILVLVWQQAPVPEVTMNVWIAAGLVGILGIVVMTVTVLYGIARMPIYHSSVIMLFELVVAAVAAWALTNEVMSLQEWFGGGLIMLAAYGVAKSEA
ncbi:MAG: drug/metabolite transporter (DMT)-like permease [Methylophagaceae bacterium]|jgi:drug/metabolite transporter (DMT)-like permease